MNKINENKNDFLNCLLSKNENELIEFKEAKESYDFDKIGKYFSALSNEANLKNADESYLVFGIKDNKTIVGTKFRNDTKRLQHLKYEIAEKITNRITFIDIVEINKDGKRVIVFKIPAAPKGIPIAYEGHWYSRDGESLVSLNIEKLERIRKQMNFEDWSAEIITDATTEDLNEEAIQLARKNYKNKFNSSEVDEWDDITFLNKAKITIKNKITRTAIILLGKPESEHFLTPSEIKIRWILKDNHNFEIDYHIESCPMVIAIDNIYKKIRNKKFRYLQLNTLFPEEVDQYEPYIIREAINNCIAHQDYTKSGRINVVEYEDLLIFSNYGKFIPESVEKVIYDDAPEEHYRNKFLTTAMFNLKMVDTVGGGIKKMFNFQRMKYFPLPEYDLTDDKVKLTIYGKIIDLDYSRVLAQNKDLTLNDVILLDKVQKNKNLNKDEVALLKLKKVIEGRYPNIYISKPISQDLEIKSQYTKNKGFEKEQYIEWIIKGIKEHNSLSRKDIDGILWKILPEWMDEKQKKIKVNHLLTEMSIKLKYIKNIGSKKLPKWILASKEK